MFEIILLNILYKGDRKHGNADALDRKSWLVGVDTIDNQAQRNN